MRLTTVILAALAAVTLQTSGRAAAGRAMTIDDLIAAVRVADPQLSPDGRTVAFVRTTTDGKTGARNADIWAVPADGIERAEAADRRREEREHAAVLAGRRAARVHLVTRRRSAGLCRRADGSNVRKLTSLAMGVAAAA